MDDIYNNFEDTQVREYFDTPKVPRGKKRNKKKNGEGDPFVAFTVRQLILCGLALLVVLIFGGWDSDLSRNVKDKYAELFCQKTSVDEVLGAFSQRDGQVDLSPTDLITATDTNTIGNAILVNSLPDKAESNEIKPLALIKTESTLWDNDNTNSIQMPLKGRVTSEFGYRMHPIYDEYLFHSGIDIGGDYGEEIVAALSGEVVEAQYSDSYGYYIRLKHSDGLETRYAHCQKLLKEVGRRVNKGDVIAEVGSTGVSTGPHLHFEIISNGNYVNPRWVLNF